MNSNFGPTLLSPPNSMTSSAVVGDIVVNGTGEINGGLQDLHSISVRRRAGVLYDSLQPGAKIQAVIAGLSTLVTLGSRIQYSSSLFESEASLVVKSRAVEGEKPECPVKVEVLLNDQPQWVSANQLKAISARVTAPRYPAAQGRTSYPPLRLVTRSRGGARLKNAVLA